MKSRSTASKTYARSTRTRSIKHDGASPACDVEQEKASPECKRGFKQVEGTCWFTSTLNSLLLGQLSSLHIRKLLESTPRSKKEVAIDQCPIEVTKDFILEYARRFYDPSPRNIQHADNLARHVIKNVENSEKNDEGSVFPIIALDKLLRECFSDKYVLIKTESSIAAPKDIADDCKFLVFYNGKKSLLKPSSIPPKLRVSGSEFVLDSCCIYMKFTRGDHHVICGFKCKNKDYVYDSNMDSPLQIDWSLSATYMSSKIRCYSSSFYEGRARLSSADFMYLIYAKTI